MILLGSRCTLERIQALAGVAQCAASVDQLAVQGRAEPDTLTFCIEAFFLRSPDQLRTYFARPEPIKPGLEQLQTLLSSPTSDDARRQIRYLFQIQHLNKEMNKRPDMLGVISAGIDQLEAQRDSLNQVELLDRIGDLYQQTISKLSFRIQVQGQHGYLRQPQTASTIRAILFCGIRYAHLWRQAGGSQFDFLLRKNQIKRIAAQLIDRSSANN